MHYADGIAEMQVCTAAQAPGREGKHKQQLSLHAAIGRWKEQNRAKKKNPCHPSHLQGLFSDQG